MSWPSEEQARAVLWLIHSVLADVRFLGYRNYDPQVAGLCCRNASEALRRVVRTGEQEALEESLRSFGHAQGMALTLREVPPQLGTAPLPAREARALMVAFAAMFDDMATWIDAGTESGGVAANADYLEYIPLEVARLGLSFVDEFRAEPEPVGRLLWQYYSRARLSTT